MNFQYRFGTSISVARMLNVLMQLKCRSDKADTLRALAYRQIQPLTHTGIAAELMHQFSSKQTTLTLGAQHSPFPFMLIKARAASDGSLATLFQHDLLSRFCLTIGAEMNVMDAMSTATLGVSLSLKV